MVDDVFAGDLVLVHAGTAISIVETRAPMREGTDFLYPFIEGDERDAGRCSPTSPARPRPSTS